MNKKLNQLLWKDNHFFSHVSANKIKKINNAKKKLFFLFVELKSRFHHERGIFIYH